METLGFHVGNLNKGGPRVERAPSQFEGTLVLGTKSWRNRTRGRVRLFLLACSKVAALNYHGL